MNVESNNDVKSQEIKINLSRSQKNDKNFMASFGDELKNLMAQGNISQSDIDNLLNGDMQLMSDEKDMKTLLNSLDTDVKYDTVKMDEQDAKFFLNMLSNNGIVYNPASSTLNEIVSEDKMIYKSQQVSKTLMSALENSYKNKQPVRIDFDNQISVIMKLDKDGKLIAQFMPNDKAAEEYLRNNLGHLKLRFDEQNIPYNELSYRQNKNQQNQKNNKEKDQ